MSRERIAEGLELLLVQLANSDSHAPPPDWLPHEWAYIRGLASAGIWELISRLKRSGSS